MDRLRRSIGAVALASLTALAVAGAGQASSAPRTATVTLRDIDFTPGTAVVRRGGSVTFAWRDGDTPHNVTPTGRLRFHRLATRQSGTARVRFTRRGTYRYVCTIHPGMAGKVVVR
jgi:plastocyanin